MISPEGGRVLGCLVEKQLTTPQQYPLTGNALSLACSQATNRDPVVAMDENAVLRALEELRVRRLVRFVLPSSGRTVKRYRHVLDEVYGIDTPCLALLAVLLLRGPQTPGELRVRTERMATFPTVGGVQEQLDVLAAHPEGVVRLLSRRPGQKEDRWRQLLAEQWVDSASSTGGGESGPSEVGWADPISDDHPPPDATVQVDSPDGKSSAANMPALRSDVEALRAEVATLRASVAELGTSLDALRRSLGDDPDLASSDG